MSLALKYRPSTFADLVGQLHASQSLKNAIEQGQVSHAYLFYGSRGVGKTSTARILARSLNCQTHGASTTPCGVCENCKTIKAGNNVDVIEMDAASNRGIDHIRDLRENARFAPMQSRYKIYIIDEVHMLTNESFNALLKILEEPPEHVVFILATTEQHKIPETILSRCQNFAFRKFSHEDIENRLRYILEQENIEFEEKSLFPIIQRAEGSMRDALSLADQVIAFCGGKSITIKDVELVLGITPTQIYLDFLHAVQKRNARDALLQIDQLHVHGTNLKQFLWDFLSFIKNALLVKAEMSDNKAILMSTEDFARLEHALKLWDLVELTAVFEHFYKLYSNWSMFQTSKTSEIRVTLEVSIIHLFHFLNQPTASQLIKKIADLKQAIQEGKPYQDKNVTQESLAQKPNKQAPQEDVSFIQSPTTKEHPKANTLEKKQTANPKRDTTEISLAVKENDSLKPTKEEHGQETDMDALLKKEFLASEEDPAMNLFGNIENEE